MKKYENLLEIYAEKIDYMPFHLSGNLRLIYVLSGTIDCRWVAGVHTMLAGEIEIINIDEPFCIEQCSEDNLVLFFEIQREKAVAYCDFIDDALFNCNTTLFYDSKTDAKAQTILKDKLRSLYQDYLVQRETAVIEEQVCEIVHFIVDHCHDLLNMLNAKRGSDPRADRFLRIYTYIYNHCNEKINLKTLAEREYVSQQYLSREFNERLNMNFKDTLEYYRVIQAVRYLITTHKTVTMISELCGFSAPRYFYKHFAMYLKCTPMEFRNQYLGQSLQVQKLSAEDGQIRDRLRQLALDGGEERPADRDEEILGFLLAEPKNLVYNRRKIPKKLVHALTEFVRHRLPEEVEVMEIPVYGTRSRITSLLGLSETAENGVAPLMLVFYTRAGSSQTGVGEFAMKAAEAGMCAYMMCQTAELKGLCYQIDFHVLLCEEEMRKVLGADEELHPLAVVAMGYRI